MSAADPRRATRRTSAIAFADDKLRIRVVKPKEAGGPWRYHHPDPVTGRRVQGRFYGTRDEVSRQYRALCADLEAERTSDWRKLTFGSRHRANIHDAVQLLVTEL